MGNGDLYLIREDSLGHSPVFPPKFDRVFSGKETLHQRLGKRFLFYVIGEDLMPGTEDTLFQQTTAAYPEQQRESGKACCGGCSSN